MSSRNTTVLAALIITTSLTSGETTAQVPGWVVYPEREWKAITPKGAGLDSVKWNAWVARQKPAGNDSWGQNPIVNLVLW